MPVFNIKELIADFESTEAKLLRMLEADADENQINAIDMEIERALSQILLAHLPTPELIAVRIEFLLNRLVGDVEEGSLSDKLKSSILEDVRNMQLVESIT